VSNPVQIRAVIEQKLGCPHTLASSSPRTIVVQLTVDGQPANQVTLLIQ